MTYFVWSLNRFVRRLIKVPLIYPLMLLTLLPSILYNGLCVLSQRLDCWWWKQITGGKTMDIVLAFFFFALGIATDAVHNRIRRDSESRAYSSGYRQAQKEENIRITARTTNDAESTVHAVARRQPVPIPVPPPDAEPVKEGNVISTDFWNNLQTNGRAAVHIRR